jgi:hypothetical protein
LEDIIFVQGGVTNWFFMGVFVFPQALISSITCREIHIIRVRIILIRRRLTMGKTGSTEWVKVKGRKGHVIKVKKADAEKAHSAPSQRYSSSGSKRRFKHRSPKSIAK